MHWHCTEHLQEADAVSMQRGAASRWCCRCWPWMWGSLLFGGQPGLLSPIPRKDPSDANLDACTQHRHEHAHASPHRAGRNGPWCPMFCGNDGMHTIDNRQKKVSGAVGTLLVPRYPQGLNNRTETKFYTSKTTEYCRLSVVCPKCSLAQVFCSKTQ